MSKQKIIHITVKTNYYDIGNYQNDMFEFYCPHTKRTSTMERQSLADLSIYDKIATEEYKYFTDKNRSNFTIHGEMSYSIKVNDDEYVEIFYGTDNVQDIYNGQEDLNKLFTILNLKIFEAMKTPQQFAKYTSLCDENTIKNKNITSTENKPEDKSIIFKNILDSELIWLNNIANENNCKAEIEWHSRYNKDAIYNYQPFCTDGFDTVIKITSNDYNRVLFIKHLFLEKSKRAYFLNDCYRLKEVGNDITCSKKMSRKI